MLQESHPLQVSFLHFNWLLSSAHSSLHSSVGCAVGDIDTEGTAVVGDVVGLPVGAIVGAQKEQPRQLGLAHFNGLSSSAHSSLHCSVGCAVSDIDTEGTAVVGDVVGSPVGAIVGAQNEQSLQLGLAHLNRLSSSAHSSSQLSGSMIQLSGQSSR